MMRRWLRSRWWWLVMCIVVGATAVSIADYLVVREGLELMEALATGLGAKPDTPRRYSVSILFGLIPIEDTSHPYLWLIVGGVLTGGTLGLFVWGLGQAGLWVWQRARRRGARRAAVPGAAPDRGGE